jgi:peroxiredoxin Q/BCP
MTHLKAKGLAPLFSLPNSAGNNINLTDFRGQYVVLYFYPKDDTPGCTIEAQDFTKRNPEFQKLNCAILGISRDSTESHCDFIKKYNINFDLLSDEKGEVCEKYGAIKEKAMFGKKYLGIDRSTFLIDKAGRIHEIWRSVKVNGHVEKILQTLKQLPK